PRAGVGITRTKCGGYAFTDRSIYILHGRGARQLRPPPRSAGGSHGRERAPRMPARAAAAAANAAVPSATRGPRARVRAGCGATLRVWRLPCRLSTWGGAWLAATPRAGGTVGCLVLAGRHMARALRLLVTRGASSDTARRARAGPRGTRSALPRGRS